MNEVTLLEGISTKPLPAKTFYGPVQVYHAAEVDAYRAKVRALVEAAEVVTGWVWWEILRYAECETDEILADINKLEAALAALESDNE